MGNPSQLARNLLSTKERRMSLIIPAEMHQTLKIIAAREGTTTKELIIEAYENYTLPRYNQEVK